MLKFEVPEEALDAARDHLNRFLSGFGQSLLAEDPDPRRFSARGAVLEAALDLDTLTAYLHADRRDLDDFFRHLRLFLFDGDRVIGYLTLTKADSSWTPETVVLESGQQLMDAMRRAEARSEVGEVELRVLSVEVLYLESVVAMQGRDVAYYGVSPPYPELRGPLALSQFKALGESMKKERLEEMAREASARRIALE